MLVWRSKNLFNLLNNLLRKFLFQIFYFYFKKSILFKKNDPIRT